MPNRLAHETSPYLLQHAHNPVDWYPWGPEALARAKAEDRPILLSVGYSACHWCHVMERESFEDAAIAERMNRDFVCVKVDREERPDLDEIYMTAVQAFTGGRGGWPMTVFLAPDGRPFFGGTYFPPTRRHGMPGLPDVLEHVARAWRDRRGDAEDVGRKLVEHLEQVDRVSGSGWELPEDWLGAVADEAGASYDARQGGFGGAPKFPPHGTLAALLAHFARTRDVRSLDMVRGTLDGMQKGGMYDLAGGGFARYSVDADWRVPHFEKMLYDNAQLLPVYTDAFKLTGDASWARVVRETLAWVAREMTLPEGGFASALDADSEGEEGKFYAWTRAEVAAVAGDEAADLLQVTAEGTFEHGTSVLRMEVPRERLSGADCALAADALARLLQARAARVRPGLDDKVIVAWNALMISACARAAAAFGEEAWLAAATRAMAFLEANLVIDGRWQRTWKSGRAHVPAMADDHANLVAACLDLYEATLDRAWLDKARDLAERTVALFWDEAHGGLFFTGHDAETLVARTKRLLGGAEPSANGVFARSAVRLAALTGDPRWQERADAILALYAPLVDRAARALGDEALAGAWHQGRALEIGLVGDLPLLLVEVRQRYLPFAVVARDAPDLPWMAGKTRPGAYVCERFSCLAPTDDPEELGRQLDAAPEPVAPARRPVRLHGPALKGEWLGSPPLALRGNVVVLDFWTHCCINCLHVLPELAAVEQRFAGEPVVVIGVHSAKFGAERERASVQAAMRRYRVRHPVINDADHDLWEQYAVKSWPTVVVLDAEGRIAWQKPGEVDRDELIRVVDELLAEARERGTLGEPAFTPGAVHREGGALSFPGKVAAWPDPAAQARGASLEGARLYVSDTGHDAIVEASVALGADGWPVARTLRRWGGSPGLKDGAEARFQMPQGLARAGDTLWVADTGNHALRAIDLATGAVRTVAGTGRRGRGGALDPTRPRAQDLRSPWDVAPLGDSDVVFVAMAGAHQLWIYLPGKDQLGVFAGSGREDHVDGAAAQAALAQPSGLALHGQLLLFADSEVSSIRAVNLVDRTVGTVVGRGLFDFGDVDGPADAVRLQHPLALTFAGGDLYVADTYNGKIKVVPIEGGETRTLASGLSEPGGVTRFGDFLVVADTNAHRLVAVRRDTGELRELPLE